MRKISFTKMVASGNDFIVGDAFTSSFVRPPSSLVKTLCDRKFGIGADGVLILGRSKCADFKMRIFNADGSEAEMCGNGARCAVCYWTDRRKLKDCALNIETLAGIIQGQTKGNKVKIKLTDPRDIMTDVPIKVGNRMMKINFINTGVPHAVIFVEGLDKIDILEAARLIRYHKFFSPKGTNVNFIEVIAPGAFKIRTYERGVEDETLACGTGSTASALIFALKTNWQKRVFVHTKSKEVLKVYFNKNADDFRDVWLEGKARIVYGGAYYV